MLTFSETLENALAEAGKDNAMLLDILHKREQLKDSVGNFFDFKNEGITYRPLDRIDNETDPWAIKGRVAGKPGKWLTRLRKENPDIRIMDSIEHAAQALTVHMLPLDNFSVVNGEQIRFWYHKENYHPDASRVLHNSCMKWVRCQPYLDLYVHNEEHCQLIVQTKEDKLVARALVWIDANGDRFLDRVYGDNKQQPLMRRFARLQGIDTNKSGRFVKLPNWDFDAFPSMDTLMYTNHKGVFATTDYNPGERYPTLKNVRCRDYVKVGWVRNPPPGVPLGHTFGQNDVDGEINNGD